MAKVNIKSEKITPFREIFHVRTPFSRFVGPIIDKVMGLRCTSYENYPNIPISSKEPHPIPSEGWCAVQ